MKHDHNCEREKPGDSCSCELREERDLLRAHVAELITQREGMTDTMQKMLEEIGKLRAENAAVRAELRGQDDSIVCLSRENMRLRMEIDVSCNAEELRQVRAGNADLRRDKERLDWLETEMDREGDGVWRDSLFRRNVPITRDAIDTAKEAKP